MRDGSTVPAQPRGMAERVLREVLKTPAFKEVVLLQMKDIDPQTAAGLVKTVLWEDPGISMSLFGAAPDAASWLLELLLELGRQLNGLPEALLKDILGKMATGIDPERLRELREVYGRLAGRILIGDEGSPEEARAFVVGAVNLLLSRADDFTLKVDERKDELARHLVDGWKAVDTEAVGRVLGRMIRLALASARYSVAAGEHGKRRAATAVVIIAVLVLMPLRRRSRRKA